MFRGFKDGRFALGLILGISLAIFVGLSLDNYPDAPSNSKAQAYEGEHERPKPERLWLFDSLVYMDDTFAQWIMALFTIVASGLLLGTLITANGTNRAAAEAAEAANKTNQIMLEERRAWISFDREIACIFSDIGGVKGSLKFDHRFKNVGKSPAFSIRVHIQPWRSDSLVGPIELFEDFTNAAIKKGRGLKGIPIIFPGEEVERRKNEWDWIGIYADSEQALRDTGTVTASVGENFGCFLAITYKLGERAGAPMGVDARVFGFEEKANTRRGTTHLMRELTMYRENLTIQGSDQG